MGPVAESYDCAEQKLEYREYQLETGYIAILDVYPGESSLQYQWDGMDYVEDNLVCFQGSILEIDATQPAAKAGEKLAFFTPAGLLNLPLTLPICPKVHPGAAEAGGYQPS